MKTRRLVRGVWLAAGWSLVTALALAEARESSPPPPASAPTSTSAPALAGEIDPPQLVVADGQLKSHPFQVFVTRSVTTEMQPTFYLTGLHWITAPSKLEEPLKPLRVLPRQRRTILIDGLPATVEGTLLVFDLSRFKLPIYKSAARYWPILEWTDPPAAGRPATRQAMASEREIYVGNLPGAALWTLVTVGAAVLGLLVWSVSKRSQITKFQPRPALLLITGPDGYLSLWRTQLLLWTFAVGSVVFLFGLVRLNVPEIPETLVALMGMSLLTGTVSAVKAKQAAPAAAVAPAPANPPPAVAPPPPAVVPAAPVVAPPAGGQPPEIRFNPGKPSWADLTATWNKNTGQVELSVSKAQMVFWTVLILVLFVSKSILLGALWPVPWEMVALTGISQAGYIGDKFTHESNRT